MILLIMIQFKDLIKFTQIDSIQKNFLQCYSSSNLNQMIIIIKNKILLSSLQKINRMNLNEAKFNKQEKIKVKKKKTIIYHLLNLIQKKVYRNKTNPFF